MCISVNEWLHHANNADPCPTLLLLETITSSFHLDFSFWRFSCCFSSFFFKKNQNLCIIIWKEGGLSVEQVWTFPALCFYITITPCERGAVKGANHFCSKNYNKEFDESLRNGSVIRSTAKYKAFWRLNQMSVGSAGPCVNWILKSEDSFPWERAKGTRGVETKTKGNFTVTPSLLQPLPLDPVIIPPHRRLHRMRSWCRATHKKANYPCLSWNSIGP